MHACVYKYVCMHLCVCVDSPPKHLDIFKRAPFGLPKPLSDQFPVHVCSCPLCIINRLCTYADMHVRV